MTDDLPEPAVRAFESHEAFEPDRDDDAWFDVRTTTFDGRVTAENSDGQALAYTLEVRAPTIASAAEGTVGPAVEEGWFETYERRLEDATMAVRQDVDLTDRRVFEEAGDAVAVFVFEWPDADRAPDIAKAIAEFVEGTYVEGVVPGYEYGPPVSEILSRARQSGGEDGERGPMPL